MLPRLAFFEPVAAAPEHVVIEDLAVAVREMVDAFVRGEANAAMFRIFLDDTARDLAEKEQQLADLDVPPSVFEIMREELELGLEGIGWVLQGLATLRLAIGGDAPNLPDGGEEAELADAGEAAIIDDPVDLSTLFEEGIALVVAGNEHLNEAMRLNRENRGRLEEACGDASTLM